MEDLAEQETLLEGQIETYKTQLAVVTEQVDAGNGELMQLQKDLSQLISLTEENLMEIKKQKLLMSLPGLTAEGSNTGAGSCDEQKLNTDGSPEETELDFEGMKCRAPLEESWGAVNYHNAIIVGREPTAAATDDGFEKEWGDNFNVRVLFTNPRYNAMKPCPFFLERSCRFTSEECKYSHGLVVPLSLLKPFHESDYSALCLGCRCLAKNTEDGLWLDAVVSSVGESLSTISVTYSNTRVEVELQPEDVLPLSDSSEDSDDGDVDLGDEKGADEEVQEKAEMDVRVLDWQPTGLDCALGEWEKHTTGFGSKILAKMGFVVGKGLGKEAQGRLEPVPIVILPAGKSLDACAAIRDGKKLQTHQRKRKRRKNRGLMKKQKLAWALEQARQEQQTDVFDFLNQKLGPRGRRLPMVGHDNSGPATMDGTRKVHSQRKGLNVKLFKIQEDMKTLQRRLQSLRESLARNKGKDKMMESRVTDKIREVEEDMQHLEQQEKAVVTNMRTKSEQKKLTIF